MRQESSCLLSDILSKLNKLHINLDLETVSTWHISYAHSSARDQRQSQKEELNKTKIMMSLHVIIFKQDQKKSK